MHGAVYGAIAILMLAVVLLGAPYLAIPLVLAALVFAFAAPLLSRLRETNVAADEPVGVPSTGDAAYQPQVDPSQRP